MRTFNKTIMVVLGTAAILALASQATAQSHYARSRSGYHRSPSVGIQFGWSFGSRPHYVPHRRHHFPAHRMVRRSRFAHRGHLYARPRCGMSRRVFVVPSWGMTRSGYAAPSYGTSRGGYSSSRRY